MLSPFTRSPLRRRQRARPTTEVALRVLVSGRGPGHAVRYADQLLGDDSAGQAPNGIDYRFSGNVIGARDVDVIHLTDSRMVLGDSRATESEQARRALRFAKALKRRRIALVRCVYGVERGSGHQKSRAERLLDDATTAYITLSPGSVVATERPVTVIRHSHFRERFLGHPRHQSIAGRLAFISPGEFHPAYEAPLKVFSVADLPTSTLRLVGQVPNGLRRSFDRSLEDHPDRISLRSESISDAARVEEISRAEMVMVAAPDTLEALQVILLVLSLDRPVLVEATPVTRVLAEEIGHQWVRLHVGPLTATSLEAAVRDLDGDPPAGRPDLTAHEPNRIAENYSAAFLAAAQR